MRHLLVRAAITLPLISLALLLVSCASMSVALAVGSVPTFDQQLMLYGQHMLTIHHGPTGIACTLDQGSLDRCTGRAVQQREFRSGIFHRRRGGSLRDLECRSAD